MTNSLTDDLSTQSVVHKYNFWILWIAANGVGTVLGTITFYILALFLGLFSGPSLPGQYTDAEIARRLVVGDFQAFLPFGALIGLMQWLVLQQHLAKSGAWFLTSAVAMFVGTAASDLLPIFLRLPSISIELFIQWGLFGLVSGLLQWIILQRQVHYARWWILANLLAGSLAGIFFTDDLGLIGGCLGWAFSGIITGGVMFFLLQKRKSPVA